MTLALTRMSGFAQAPLVPPGSAGWQNENGGRGLFGAGQTTMRAKPIEDGPQITRPDRGVGGLAEAGLQDGNPSGRLCAWSGVVHGAYAGTSETRIGDAPTGVWCVALAAWANARTPNEPNANARSALL